MVSDENLSQNQESRNRITSIDRDRISYSGLKTIYGRVFEECKEDLRFPNCISTFKLMAKDATIFPALNYVESQMSQVDWDVEIPEGYEEELKDKAIYLKQCMDDLEDGSWVQFIRQASTFNRFGFGIHEVVLRYRRKKDGSKYNDGLIGIRSLPQISQDSIYSWEYDDEGKSLIGIKQAVIRSQGTDNITVLYKNVTDEQKIFIPRSKFLHFKNTATKSNPEGSSPLVGCYLAWKYKSELEKFQALGIASDVRGLKILYVPPNFLNPQGSEEEKETFKYFKDCMNSIHLGEQSGFILPNVMNDRGNKQFEFDVVSVMGQKAYDVTQIIQNYRNEILSCLAATQLGLGQGGNGSFSLAETLQGISNVVIKSRLLELQDEINHHLVRKLFEINGWDTAVMPKIVFGELSKPDLDVLSKFLQRVGSQGLISSDPRSINWIAEQANMPAPFDDITIPVEEARKQLTGFSTNAGEGMEEGMPSGTGKANGGGDKSIGNNENGG